MRQKFRTNQEPSMRLEDMAVNSDMSSRKAIASALGFSFGGDRDLYNACGYMKSLASKDFYAKYIRDDIASTIVDAYPEATWSGFPAIQEVDDLSERDATEFEESWISLVKKLRLNNKFLRADRLTGLGHYAILVLGFKGESSEGKGALAQPVTGTDNELIYVQPYSEKNSQIIKYNEDETDERFGLPEIYEIIPRPLTESTAVAPVQQAYRVHWTRVIHLVEKPLDNEVFGTPRLEAVFNRLVDLLKIAGGSGEGIWRGAFPGHAAVAKDGYKFEAGAEDSMKEQFSDYRHNLTRVLTLAGVDIKNLDTSPANPKWAFDLQMALISATSRIPLRILTGSERGVQASDQDEANWNRRVDERKIDIGTDVFLRPFVDRLMEFGALPTVEKYAVTWPDQEKKDPEKAAGIAKTIAEALKAYIEGSVDLIIPPSVFLRNILNLDEDIIEKIEEILGSDLDNILEHEEEEEEEEIIPITPAAQIEE